MLSRIIMLPFILTGGFSLYKMFFDYSDIYAFIFSGCVLMIAAILMIEPQLNVWWVEKKPPKTDPSLRNFLYNYIPFYRGLTYELRLQFEQMLAKNEYRFEVISKTDKDLSADIKTLSCIYPTILDFNHQLGLAKKVSRVALYAHPFLSPVEMEHVHVSELDFEDGIYVYTIEHLQLGFKSNRFFNIALYEPAKAFLMLSDYREKIAPVCPEIEEILTAGPYDSKALQAFCGLLPDDREALLIHHFFNHPDEVKKLFPEAFPILKEIFGDHHLLSKNPLLY